MPLILGSIYPYKLLFLALVLSTLSYASHFKRDINVISFKGLIEVISMVKSIKNVLLIINYIKSGLRRLVINYWIF